MNIRILLALALLGLLTACQSVDPYDYCNTVCDRHGGADHHGK